MGVIRKAKRTGYTKVSNKLAQDRSLSFEARGVALYLLSKPDDWEIQFEDVEKEGGIGRDKRQRIFKELEDARYFERSESRNSGQFGYDFILHEEAIPEKPVAVLPVPENPVAVINKEQIKDFTKERVDKQPLQAASTRTVYSSWLGEPEEPSLQIFKQYSPDYCPNLIQQNEIIETTKGTMASQWTACCKFWSMHGWSFRNVTGLLECYSNKTYEQAAPENQLTKERVVIDDFDRCPICENGMQSACPYHKENYTTQYHDVTVSQSTRAVPGTLAT